MKVWRLVYIALLSGAIATGRPNPQFVAVLLFNLIGSVSLGSNPDLLAFVDLASFMLLIGGNVTEKTVGTIFGAMAIFEVFAYRLHISPGVIYAWTDPLSWVQCVVIGGANGGVGRLRNAVHRLGNLRRSGGFGLGRN